MRRTMQKARRVTGRRIVTGRGVRESWNPLDERPLRVLKRNRTRNLLALVNTTLRALKIGAVPASPWQILAVCAGCEPGAPTQKIAFGLETTVPCLSDTVAIMEREMLGQGETYWNAAVLIDRLRTTRERMLKDESEGTYDA